MCSKIPWFLCFGKRQLASTSLTASDSSVRFHPGSWIKRSEQLPFSRACWTSQLWALRSSTMISSSGLFPGRLGTEEIWRCLKMLGNPKSMISHGLSSFSQLTCVIFLVYLTFSDRSTFEYMLYSQCRYENGPLFGNSICYFPIGFKFTGIHHVAPVGESGSHAWNHGLGCLPAALLRPWIASSRETAARPIFLWI